MKILIQREQFEGIAGLLYYEGLCNDLGIDPVDDATSESYGELPDTLALTVASAKGIDDGGYTK